MRRSGRTLRAAVEGAGARLPVQGPAPFPVAAVAAAALSLLATPPAAAQEAAMELGREADDRGCAGCHGVDGAGEGPAAAYMLPRPRDFTRAEYQIRTTASGQLPSDEDILHVIDVGMPGTAMPGWEEVLTRQERDALVVYLKSLSRFFQNAQAPEIVDFGSAPRANEERIAHGAELYRQIECWQCHGDSGRGEGTSAPTLEDGGGYPVYAANLHKNWLFNGGGTAEDIYRRLRTGMDGTPMPTFSDLIAADILTEEDLWDLALYVRSLAPEEPPRVREVIRAELLEEGELPTGPGDERWAEVDRFYVPLVGQIILAPRWFSPRVTNVWVQALHDGEEVALRVTWADPSRSPDPRWAEFGQRVWEHMEPKDPGASWEAGAPDRLVVQFPQNLTEGMERPYFLQGDPRRPAYLWAWESTADRVTEEVAEGMGTGEPQPSASQTVESAAGWEAGRWSVVMRRSLATADTAADLQLPVGTAVPVAFQAWDGDNGESGFQGAVSSWYFLALAQPTPNTVFVAPALAMVLTAGLGLLVVARAQKREREGEDTPPPVGDRET